MTTLSRTVTVDRPVDRVAAYLSDFSTSAEWDPHTVSCTRLSPAPTEVGSRFENVQTMLRRRVSLVYTVTEYEPGRRIVLGGGNDTVRSRDEMVFAATPAGGTSVTYTVDVQLQGPAKLAQFVMPLMMKKVADEGASGMHAALQRL